MIPKKQKEYMITIIHSYDTSDYHTIKFESMNTSQSYNMIFNAIIHKLGILRNIILNTKGTCF